MGNRKYTPKFVRKSYYDNLIENHNHPIKNNKTLSKCLYCEKVGNKWDYKTQHRLYCSDECKLNYRVKFAVDNNIKTKSKRRNGAEITNDFSRSIVRKIFEHDLLKPNKKLIKLAIEKFILDVYLADYLCPECLRPVELKKNLRGDVQNTRSFGYNVELTHIEHDRNINEIEFDDDFNIISKSVMYKCSNCHSLEYKQPLRTEVK